MFNNTFLGNTFACYIYCKEGGKKKISHSLTLETAAQTSASAFHGWICSGLCQGRGALRFGAVSASRGSNISNIWSCALFHHLTGTARLVFVTESQRGSPQSTGPPPNSLLCLCSWRNPCSSSCREGRPRAQLTQQSLPFFLKTQSTRAGFVPTFQSSQMKVFQFRFLQLKVQ